MATIAENGTTIFHREPIYHLDPIRKKGILVFNIFGQVGAVCLVAGQTWIRTSAYWLVILSLQESIDKLCDLGFDTELNHLNLPSKGILGVNAYIFVATKPRELLL